MLDTSEAATDRRTSNKGGRLGAAGILATRANVENSQLLGKAKAVARRFEILKAAHARAQAEAALTRSQLSQGMADALAARAAALVQLREMSGQAYRLARAGQVSPRRRNRISRLIDKVLVRLRSLGRAVVIARSGLWASGGSGWRAFSAMVAYARSGPLAAAQPPSLLDHDWYLGHYPDVAAAPLSPLVHYLVAGGREGRSPHPLFHSAFYMDRNGAELGASGLTPLEHFVHLGASQGCDPHPLFSIDHYVAQHPELIDSGENPLAHYLTVGWRLGLSPHPLFAPDFYGDQLGAAERDVPPLVHYLTVGSARGLKPHPLFDPAWYRAKYADIAQAGLEPLTHFALSGWKDGRSPSGWFDTAHYVALRGLGLSPQVNPLLDYLEGGAWQVGEARPGFPTAAYLAATPSLAAEGLTPLEHWARLEAP